ncbi:MAG: GerW family sporulation protein [Peptococcaceae bacterium]|nr:GerW family sporulation protein [Peptococcaceae bacterium]
MPEQHPIEGLMKTAMESIKEMVDVNTVVGDPVETPDGMVIIPISRVACGFAAGGGEFEIGAERKDSGGEAQVPGFGGGSGAGVSVKPIGFLVVGNGQVRLLPVDGNAVFDRLIDVAPQILNQIQSMFKRQAGQPGAAPPAAAQAPAAPQPPAL